MNLYEHTIVVKQNHSDKQLISLKTKYSKIIEKNDGEIIKIDDWGLLNLSHEINKNKKYILLSKNNFFIIFYIWFPKMFSI